MVLHTDLSAEKLSSPKKCWCEILRGSGGSECAGKMSRNTTKCCCCVRYWKLRWWEDLGNADLLLAGASAGWEKVRSLLALEQTTSSELFPSWLQSLLAAAASQLRVQYALTGRASRVQKRPCSQWLAVVSGTLAPPGWLPRERQPAGASWIIHKD